MDLISRLRTTVHSWAALIIQPASAHCDTEDGPAVNDGRKALQTGVANHALKWILPEADA